ncbi:hypothetical protein W97_07848 [Coniosporium apollinis CBS 100218]|uniref:Isochorismatase-like domain-containing protein n=1 Tax=Coniosporium apollinis (strain CBS 100218) TaxID=1168221 RepID=R7Z351_CONA1|nr:uncharacterized protein W97_07848 [Coniosporium apollinis CBS 100218]EON68590.1 hypothetical protein W97_07848 [Coniosporium apollinis CBS 100218]
MPPALLIIDMQNIFAPMTKAALPKIQHLHAFFASKGWPRIFTQHGHSKAELTSPFTNQLVRKWGPDGSIAKGSHDWKLMPAVQKLVDADADADASSGHDSKEGEAPLIIAKNTYDAFLGIVPSTSSVSAPSQLEELLRARDVTRVVVCGVMTDCCCDTTARSAFNRGFETWLVSDACGSANRRQHEAGLRGFGFAFGEVLETEEVVARLEKGD